MPWENKEYKLSLIHISQAAIERAKPPIVITHAPGHMFITNVKNAELNDYLEKKKQGTKSLWNRRNRSIADVWSAASIGHGRFCRTDAEVRCSGPREWDSRGPASWQNPKSMLFYQTLKLVWIFREELFSPHNHLKALWVVVWFFYVTGNSKEFPVT